MILTGASRMRSKANSRLVEPRSTYSLDLPISNSLKRSAARSSDSYLMACFPSLSPHGRDLFDLVCLFLSMAILQIFRTFHHL